MNGTCIRENFLLLKNAPIISEPEEVANTGECCFELIALAEEVKNIDPIIADLRNDQHSFIEYFDKILYSGAEMFLQKYVSGIWTDQGAVLSDNTYGTNYPFGFFETIYDENAIGFNIDFHKVITALGEGDYRLKAQSTDIFGNEFKSYSLALCLRKYTQHRADYTSRFSWNRNGNNGEPRDNTRRRDYGSLNWFNQLRVPGIFWKEEATINRENVKYQNGAIEWLKDELINEYTFNSDRMPDYVHMFLKYDMMQSDNILITDFNIVNPTMRRNLRIYPNSGYVPVYDAQALYAPVELKFIDRIQQFVHKRS